MELACIILTAITSVFSAITAFLSCRNGKLVSQGNIELQIRTMISEAKYRVLSYQESNIEVFNALNEELLNAYDEACSKYIDNKVDKDRFNKMYCHEIRELIEDDNYKSIFNQASCRYDAILKVYNMWYHKDR